MIETIPEGSRWELVAKKLNFPMVMAALSMGGHVRIGFEDNIFISPGKLADGNAQLIEKAVRMVHDVGREAATVPEAREFWGI